MKRTSKKVLGILLSAFFAVTIFSACNNNGNSSSDAQSENNQPNEVCSHQYDNACDVICNLCNEERDVPDHVYDNDCDILCKVCQTKRVAPHSYDNACDDMCNLCSSIRETPDHVYDNSCDTTCNICLVKRNITHKYDNDCDTTCNVCHKEREVPDHVYDDDFDATCNVCNEERTIAHTHTYDDDCDTTCNVCNDERTVPHSYDNDCDTTCNLCSATREVPDHVYDDDFDGSCNSCSQTRIVPDKNDLSDLTYASSKIINNWMAVSDLALQNECISDNSTSAIKGVFNYRMGEAYTEMGGHQIWTAVGFDLQAYLGTSQNLTGKVISFDLKIENCQNTPSLFVTDANGQKQTEYAFNIQAQDGELENGTVKTSLSNGWVRICVYPEYLYDSEVISQIQSFSLVFSNVNCNEEENSVFYIDNVSVQEGDLPWFKNAYNPTGYYSYEKRLTVKIVGNSFIYYSQTAAWLQILGGNLDVSFDWTSGGRIPDQYEKAFGENGYMDGTYTPDLVYVQDFYSLGDALAFNDFARTMHERSPNTELKIYPAENETEAGIVAAKKLGLDLVNWRAAIKELKTKGYTATNLNDQVDGWHPSILSGLVGALMIYMDIYGEVPDLQMIWLRHELITDFYNKHIDSYLPGQTEIDKQQNWEDIFKLAQKYTGAWSSEEICFHNWTSTIIAEPTCQSYGINENTCVKCNVSYLSSVDIRKHYFDEFGICPVCSTRAPIDDGDYAALAYLYSSEIAPYTTTAILEDEFFIVSENSTSSIKGTFSHVGADAYTQSGANQIWCVVLLDFTTIYEQEFADMRGKTISFDVKVENCEGYCSTLILDNATNKSPEPMFNNTPTDENIPNCLYTKTVLSNGWVRITAQLDSLFTEHYLMDATQFGIVFNNVEADESQPCVFYLDNIHIS